MISRLHAHYRQHVIAAMQKKFSYRNVMAVPTVKNLVINIGFGRQTKDSHAQTTATKTLERVTGQKPVLTKARKSISAFKLREGTVIGAKVTLRGERMWEFLDKFFNVTLARIRDFHGLDPKGLNRGTFTVGIREHIVFPEIQSDEIEHLHGLEVSINTTARTPAEGLALLTELGFPLATK